MKLQQVTYKPLKNNRYRLVVDGIAQMGKENIWTQRQILQHGLRLLEQGHSLRTGVPHGKTTSPKKSLAGGNKPSPYRAKQDRGK